MGKRDHQKEIDEILIVLSNPVLDIPIDVQNELINAIIAERVAKIIKKNLKLGEKLEYRREVIINLDQELIAIKEIFKFNLQLQQMIGDVLYRFHDKLFGCMFFTPQNIIAKVDFIEAMPVYIKYCNLIKNQLKKNHDDHRFDNHISLSTALQYLSFYLVSDNATDDAMLDLLKSVESVEIVDLFCKEKEYLFPAEDFTKCFQVTAGVRKKEPLLESNRQSIFYISTSGAPSKIIWTYYPARRHTPIPINLSACDITFLFEQNKFPGFIELNYVRLANVNLAGKRINTIVFKNCDFSHANLSYSDLKCEEKMCFYMADLTAAKIQVNWLSSLGLDVVEEKNSLLERVFNVEFYADKVLNEVINFDFDCADFDFVKYQNNKCEFKSRNQYVSTRQSNSFLNAVLIQFISEIAQKYQNSNDSDYRNKMYAYLYFAYMVENEWFHTTLPEIWEIIQKNKIVVEGLKSHIEPRPIAYYWNSARSAVLGFLNSPSLEIEDECLPKDFLFLENSINQIIARTEEPQKNSVRISISKKQ